MYIYVNVCIRKNLFVYVFTPVPPLYENHRYLKLPRAWPSSPAVRQVGHKTLGNEWADQVGEGEGRV